ncbi:sulfotransferase domain-containing protein [Oceanobacillus rekensis]|uniref:sulfotransferase domain-containing protein n=1 Tax=Oceanobacillus rekensis TaxID=937927 RepID=UPI000B44CF21|nr:sulfotransferase domain-containing protein [Oceanobacillus rekensis]
MSKGLTYKIQSDDICIVAYPKSGNNYLLFLIGTLLYRKKIDWANRFEFIQRLKEEMVDNLPSPHLVWSHESYDFTYPKVIYLVRDPRDIVISYYFHHLKYLGEGSKLMFNEFNEFFEKFLLGNVWPGMWDESVESWITNQKNVKNGFLLVKYEDLLIDTSREVYRLLKFLNLDRTDEEIQEAIDWASFDNMKSLEVKQKEPLNPSEFNDRNIPFVREGRVGGWKSFLNKEQQQIINQKFYSTLLKMEYKVT